MNNFRELKAPQVCGGGWYVAAVFKPAAWLTINGDITIDTSLPAIDLIYHKTEHDAFVVTAKYYNEHGLAYACPKASTGLPNDVVSQEMTF